MLSSHPQTCNCRLHREIEEREIDARRHAGYRLLAGAILGPNAPRHDAALARALAEHAHTVRVASNLSFLRAA